MKIKKVVIVGIVAFVISAVAFYALAFYGFLGIGLGPYMELWGGSLENSPPVLDISIVVVLCLAFSAASVFIAMRIDKRRHGAKAKKVAQ